jgi:hypothetical protein
MINPQNEASQNLRESLQQSVSNQFGVLELFKLRIMKLAIGSIMELMGIFSNLNNAKQNVFM